MDHQGRESMRIKNMILSAFEQDPLTVLRTLAINDVKQFATNWSARCPLHPDTNPSFSISIRTGLWKCHAGCGAGDLFQLYGRLRGIDSKKQFPNLLKRFASELRG
ncbi:MAG: hypothetical protein EOP05_00550 [Proteobacteria bacterium]|nr:MAG: hypothetical protein EOP05_00550 [Pseudomonadota bacterium]